MHCPPLRGEYPTQPIDYPEDQRALMSRMAEREQGQRLERERVLAEGVSAEEITDVLRVSEGWVQGDSLAMRSGVSCLSMSNYLRPYIEDGTVERRYITALSRRGKREPVPHYRWAA